MRLYIDLLVRLAATLERADGAVVVGMDYRDGGRAVGK